MEVRYDGLGGRAQRRLADQPAALLRRALPGLVPARTPTASPTTTRPLVPDEARLPVDPTTDVPAGYTAEPARRARRLRRRPRRHGHLGHLVAHPADRGRLGGRPRPVRRHLPDGPAPAGPRDHPHLAVLHHAALPPRARRLPWTHTTHQRLDPRPGPQEDVQVQGQRGHPDGAARGVRLRRRALLGLQRPARHRHRGRHGQHEDRPAPGDQGAQRVEVRPRPPGRGPGAGLEAVHRARSTAPCWPSWPRLVEAATAAFEAFDYARALERTEALLLVVLRRLRRAGQDPRLRRGLDRPARTRPGPPWPSRSPSCCACSPRSCPSSPRRSGAGGRRARCTGGLAHRGRGRPARRRRVPTCSTWPPRCSVRSAARRRRTSARCGPAWRPSPSPARRRRSSDVEAARGDLVDAGGVDNLVTEEGPALSVEVVLADEA